MPELEVQRLLQEGISAAKAAQQAHARELLLQVVETDQTNLLAWLWLSTVMADLDDKATCLNNVLALEPDNAQAKAGLAWIKRQRSPAEEPEVPAQPPSDSETDLLFVEQPYTGSETDQPDVSLLLEEEPVQIFSQDDQVKAVDCPFCGKPISSTKTVCPHCDVPLVMACPKCNTLMDVEWDICSECGYGMGDFHHGSVYFTRLAMGYQQSQQPSKGLEAILIAERMDPEQPDLYRVKGELQHEVGHIEESIVTLRLAVEKEPEQVGPYLSLGRALRQEGRWRQAEEVYREAIRVASDSSEAHFAYGDLMLQRRRTKRARKHLRQAVKLDPLHGQAWAQLGQYYESSRKRSSAIKAYRKALKLLPQNSIVLETVETRLRFLTG